MRMNTGALQPWGVRQLTTPWPYWAPTTNAPFFMLGTTPMHVAFSVISFGIALSGVAMISLITLVAALRRASRSVLLEAATAVRLAPANPSPTTTKPARNFLIGSSFSQMCSRNKVRMDGCYVQSPEWSKHRPSLDFAHLRCGEMQKGNPVERRKGGKDRGEQNPAKNRGCERLLRPFAPHSPDLRCSDYHQTPSSVTCQTLELNI